MRTDLSEEHVATSGRFGCGEVSQARESEGGVRRESKVRVLGRGIGNGVAIKDTNWHQCFERVLDALLS